MVLHSGSQGKAAIELLPEHEAGQLMGQRERLNSASKPGGIESRLLNRFGLILQVLWPGRYLNTLAGVCILID